MSTSHPDVLDIPTQTTTASVTRGRQRFTITAAHASILHTPLYAALHAEILRLYAWLVASPAERGHMPAQADLLVAEALPLISRLAPSVSIRGLNIRQLVEARHYHLRIEPVPGNARNVRVVGEDDFTIEPAYHISPLPATSLPAWCAGMPRIDAGEVWIAPSPENADDAKETGHVRAPWMLPQGKVVLGDGRVRYFKHRMNASFDREVDTLGRVKSAALDKEDGVKVVRLTEVVVADDQIVGLLTGMIENGYTLMNKKAWEEQELARKVEAQVRHTVQVLHQHDIVWGDVNPGNVVIDANDGAWVIDFGGQNAPRFIDDELTETKEGDLQGLERIFQEWLPSRRKDTHQENRF